MIAAPPPWILATLSRPRFDSYVRAAHGDVDAAVRLYWWNIEVSTAFYGLLHCLEVALRNALHTQLCNQFGRSDWWSAAPLSADGARTIVVAKRKLLQRGTPARTADDIVAQLTFGFWVSLVSRGRGYDRSLWVPALHKAFPHYAGPRRSLHDNLVAMLLLRNRMMHYEPIHHRDLAADRAKIYRILGYLSLDMVNALLTLDRVPEVLARRLDVCAGHHPARF
jgi:hypothetical protein